MRVMASNIEDAGATSTSGRDFPEAAFLNAGKEALSRTASTMNRHLNVLALQGRQANGELRWWIKERHDSWISQHGVPGHLALQGRGRRRPVHACLSLSEASSSKAAGKRADDRGDSGQGVLHFSKVGKARHAKDEESRNRLSAWSTSGKAKLENVINTTKHLFSGALSACVARTCVAPLERLKLEYIVRGTTRGVGETVTIILRSEGVVGFWRGNLVNLLRTAPFKSINFFAFDMFKKRFVEFSGRHDLTNFERGMAGALAGITATICCFPMDTIRTRMVADSVYFQRGVGGSFVHIVRTDGFLGLYRGLYPALFSMAPAGAVFYGVYDFLKQSYLKSPEGQREAQARREEIHARMLAGSSFAQSTISQMELGPLRTMLYGAIAGACAETAIYPLEVVRRQLQLQSVRGMKLSLPQTVREILRASGPRGFYAGWLPSTLQVLPSAALSYFVYELAKSHLRVK